jgi:hypothetical protein
MMQTNAADLAEASRKLALETCDVDRQALLHFIADGWMAMARTGDPQAAVPDYLRVTAAERQEEPAFQ